MPDLFAFSDSSCCLCKDGLELCLVVGLLSRASIMRKSEAGSESLADGSC